MRCALFLLVFGVSLARAADDAAVIRSAVAAMQHGEFAAAEKTLRAELHTDPNDPAVLSLLGAALDRQNKIREAEPFHRRALAAAPRSLDVLGNYGNHMAAAGNEDAARDAFQRIVAIDPANASANFQLARLALKHNDARQALRYLDHMPAPAREAAERDPSMSFALGVALANAKEFARAETYFSRVLEASPGDFNALFNLGAVALSAGHYNRAHAALDAALRQQPENTEVLYRLAQADYALKQPESAITLLARAAKIAPQRADIQKLLAVTTTEVGALDDAMNAWNRYLELAPGDDTARRERGHTEVRMGRFEEGLADLKWFLARHPGDVSALYELGFAEEQTDPAQALVTFNQALKAKPDFGPALSARGELYYQMGKTEAALVDLEPAAKLLPGNSETLDRLGQTYAALDRPADAARVLRKAAELAPTDSKIQLHLARALAAAGQTAESKAAMDRFRQLGPAPKNGVPAGLVAYLSLSPEQRRADYRARVLKAVREHPEDPAVQGDYLKLLLEDGKLDEAAATARRIANLKPRAEVRMDVGRALLAAGQYQLAKELLEPAGPSADLAMANLHLLDASGKPDAVLAEAVQAHWPVSAFYWHAVSILLKRHSVSHALSVVNHGAKVLPHDDEIALMHAVLLELSGKKEESQQELQLLLNRRPEWAALSTVRKLQSDQLRTLIESKPADEW